MNRIPLTISGMHCVSCEGIIAKELMKIEGVQEAKVSFASGTSEVIVDDGFTNKEALVEAVQRAGYSASFTRGGKEPYPKRELFTLIGAALFTAPLLLQMLYDVGVWDFLLPVWIQVIAATIVQFFFGWGFYSASFSSLKNKSLNMDVLVMLGTSAAYFYSLVVYLFSLPLHLYFESSATIITLVLLGRFIENRTKGRAKEAIHKLLSLSPKTATIQREGKWVTLPLEEVKIGEHFQVKPGESVALDGEVIEGESYIDESMMTGEAKPVGKRRGGALFAGTQNQAGFLVAKATAVGSETALAKIIAQVERASGSRAPMQSLADKVSSYFIPAVLLIALLTFCFWWFFSGELQSALINSVSVLVVACPCALGLATPIIVMMSMGLAAKKGIYVKDSEALQKARKIQTMIVDKTGTLTEGKFQLTEVMSTDEISEKRLKTIAASLEAHSDHPIARILTKSSKETVPVTHFTNVEGKGVQGTIEGKEYFLGSLKWAEKENPFAAARTVVVLFDKEKTYGYFGLSDPLKSDAKEAISALKKRGISTVMLTGDHHDAALPIAKEAGVEQFFADLLPLEKSAKVEMLAKKGTCAFAGDGINDAPSLALADVSFAMRRGSDIAMESADITLMQSALMPIVATIALSKRTFSMMGQNLFLAFIYNTLAIPFAAFGFLNPIIAAALMALSSLSVVLNSLRL